MCCQIIMQLLLTSRYKDCSSLSNLLFVINSYKNRFPPFRRYSGIGTPNKLKIERIMTLVFTYILIVLVAMILNQVYVDAYEPQCIECDDDRKGKFCRESIDDNGQSSFTAFTFTLDHNTIKWKKGDIVKYTRKLTNIGNCYNSNTGIFTVKTDGVYAVSAAMIGGPNQSTHYSIRKNGQQIVWLFTGPTYDMAAQTVNLILKKGDRLWIQLEWLPVHIYNIKHPYHQFSAVLIKPGKF